MLIQYIVYARRHYAESLLIPDPCMGTIYRAPTPAIVQPISYSTNGYIGHSGVRPE